MTMTPHAPLMLDVAGHSLSLADRQRLSHPLVGGIILFGRNWHNRAQLTALCADIKALRPDLLIAVDHEGGRVQRFRSDGFTHLPAMARLGALATQADGADQPPGSARVQACNVAVAAGRVLGAELRACGVDLSFTPVLDLNHGESAVIGDRAFARDPVLVAHLAQALVLGLQQSGMAHCAKHFPGHGFVQADSHEAIPIDPRSLPAILADDAAPYRWLSASLQAVMPAHVIYPEVDSRPAGFSSRWLQDLLRAQLGFQGAVFSDDLSMEAARHLLGRQLSFTEAVLAALSAGADMALVCNQSVVDEGAPLDRLLDELSHAQTQGLWQPSPASEQRRRALLPAQPAPGWDQLMAQPAYQHALRLLAAASLLGTA